MRKPVNKSPLTAELAHLAAGGFCGEGAGFDLRMSLVP
jgi:hypothetical protein